MNSRLFGPTSGMAAAALVVSILVTNIAKAQTEAKGPEYTYVGISYQWTDVKYGVNPKVDDRFNNGTIEGENIEASLGILGWLHVQGQYFGLMEGTCVNCNTNPNGSNFDADMEGYKIGAGVNLGLDMIGMSEAVDFVLRANFIDTELSNLNFNSPSTISDDGWSVETMIAGRISDRADVSVGFEYTDLSSVKNRDVTVALNYLVFDSLSVLARGIVFDSEAGFELGLRWKFGDLLSGE